MNRPKIPSSIKRDGAYVSGLMKDYGGMYKSDEEYAAELLPIITAVVRAADKHFERVGGSSRHWVRDCFLPELEKHGLMIVPTRSSD